MCLMYSESATEDVISNLKPDNIAFKIVRMRKSFDFQNGEEVEQWQAISPYQRTAIGPETFIESDEIPVNREHFINTDEMFSGGLHVFEREADAIKCAISEVCGDCVHVVPVHFKPEDFLAAGYYDDEGTVVNFMLKAYTIAPDVWSDLTNLKLHNYAND